MCWTICQLKSYGLSVRSAVLCWVYVCGICVCLCVWHVPHYHMDYDLIYYTDFGVRTSKRVTEQDVGFNRLDTYYAGISAQIISTSNMRNIATRL